MKTYRPAIATDDEPWVELSDGRALADWNHADEIAFNQTLRQAHKHQFYMLAFDFLSANEIGGDYFEFGCHRVRTFRMALTEARRKNFEHMHFVAFDSFEGLPPAESEPGVRTWTKASLATSQNAFMALVEKHGIYTDRVSTVPGFFSDSLTDDLAARLAGEGRKVGFACVDCDLYESAVPVFRFLDRLLQPGSLIYIDDYYVGYKGDPNAGVARAFAEFMPTSRFRFEPHLNIGWWGRSFITCKKT